MIDTHARMGSLGRIIKPESKQYNTAIHTTEIHLLFCAFLTFCAKAEIHQALQVDGRSELDGDSLIIAPSLVAFLFGTIDGGDKREQVPGWTNQSNTWASRSQ